MHTRLFAALRIILRMSSLESQKILLFCVLLLRYALFNRSGQLYGMPTTGNKRSFLRQGRVSRWSRILSDSIDTWEAMTGSSSFAFSRHKIYVHLVTGQIDGTLSSVGEVRLCCAFRYEIDICARLLQLAEDLEDSSKLDKLHQAPFSCGV